MKKGNPTEAASNTHENTDENAYVFDIQESCIKVNVSQTYSSNINHWVKSKLNVSFYK